MLSEKTKHTSQQILLLILENNCNYPYLRVKTFILTFVTNKINMKFTLTFCLLLTYVFSYSQTNNDSIAVVKLLEKAATTFRVW